VQHGFHGLNEMKLVAERALDCCVPSSRPAFKLLGAALVAIDKYAPIIDVMVQQQPFIVNLVWGGIRFIIFVSLEERLRLEARAASAQPQYFAEPYLVFSKSR